MTITELLDELRIAYLERGCAVDRQLQPGLPRDEPATNPLARSDAARRPRGAECMAERSGRRRRDVRGCHDLPRPEVRGRCRRPSRVPAQPAALRAGGGRVPYGFELAETFPFAPFMGSSYVIVCGAHDLASPHPHPIVSVFQGVDLFFHSLETMLRTCLDWVRHPDWGTASTLPHEVEQRIWQQHNPGRPPLGSGLVDVAL